MADPSVAERGISDRMLDRTLACLAIIAVAVMAYVGLFSASHVRLGGQTLALLAWVAVPYVGIVGLMAWRSENAWRVLEKWPILLTLLLWAMVCQSVHGSTTWRMLFWLGGVGALTGGLACVASLRRGSENWKGYLCAFLPSAGVALAVAWGFPDLLVFVLCVVAIWGVYAAAPFFERTIASDKSPRAASKWRALLAGMAVLGFGFLAVVGLGIVADCRKIAAGLRQTAAWGLQHGADLVATPLFDESMQDIRETMRTGWMLLAFAAASLATAALLEWERWRNRRREV